jgi:putative hemolysin
VIAILLVFAATLLLAAIFSGMETGIYSLERVRLEVAAARGDRVARRLLDLTTRPAAALCALLLATNVAHYLLADFADAMVAGAAPDLDEIGRKVLDTLILGPVLFVFGDLLPKNVFMRAPGGLMRTFLPVLWLLNLVFRPFTYPIVKLAARAEDADLPANSSIFDRGSIHFLLTADEESTRLTGPQREVAERVLTLRSLRVQDRMIPLKRVAAIREGASAADIVAVGARSGHSRLPIFDGAGRSFVGYVSVIDAATAAGPFDLTAHRHDLPAVPCDLPVTAALYRLQRAGRPIAAVVTPDGRTTLGIVAVSDIVAALFRV